MFKFIPRIQEPVPEQSNNLMNILPFLKYFKNLQRPIERPAENILGKKIIFIYFEEIILNFFIILDNYIGRRVPNINNLNPVRVVRVIIPQEPSEPEAGPSNKLINALPFLKFFNPSSTSFQRPIRKISGKKLFFISDFNFYQTF